MIKLIVLLLSFFYLSACTNSHETPKLIEVPKPAPKSQDDIDGVNLNFKPSADVLFVIDNSGSMRTHQTNLSNNVGQFTKAIFNNALIDFHIGVVTSDMDFDRGALFSKSNHLWVERSTPNRSIVLSENMMPGDMGSATEMFFEPVVAALSPPLINGANQGFYRSEAFLAIVFITDSKNNGPLNADSFWSFLTKLKAYEEDKLVAYGAIIPTGTHGCSRDPDGQPYEIQKVLEYKVSKTVPGQENYFNLCSNDFGQELARIGEDLERRIELFVPLEEVPVIDTISVRYGTQEIPNDPYKGWTYDINRVGLVLGNQIEVKEQKNAQLSVSYIPAIVR